MNSVPEATTAASQQPLGACKPEVEAGTSVACGGGGGHFFPGRALPQGSRSGTSLVWWNNNPPHPPRPPPQCTRCDALGPCPLHSWLCFLGKTLDCWTAGLTPQSARRLKQVKNLFPFVHLLFCCYCFSCLFGFLFCCFCVLSVYHLFSLYVYLVFCCCWTVLFCFARWLQAHHWSRSQDYTEFVENTDHTL